MDHNVLKAKLSLAILATHPIQYHIPIFRRLAANDSIALKVFFASDMSLQGYNLNKGGFGVPVKWDLPLLEGYESHFLDDKSPLEVLGGSFRFDRLGVWRAISGWGADALLLCSNYTSLLTLRAFWAAWKSNIPILIRGDNSDGTSNVRTPIKQLIRTAFLRLLYSKISGFLAVGNYMHRHFKNHGVPEERIFWSPHCVDDIRFSSECAEWMPKRQRVRRELCLDEDLFVFLYSGRLSNSVKNIFSLAEAVEEMSDTHSVAMLVMGDGDDRTELQNRLHKVLGNRAIFVGFKNQTELAKYYCAADALVLCSLRETWGLVVNEAQIFGLPVIISDSVGCREDLVTPGLTGLVFPAGDAKTLAKCMITLSAEKDMARQMGREGQKRVQSYSVNEAAAGIVRALEYVTWPRV